MPLSVRYVPGTMVLETTWLTPSGWLVVRDGLTIGAVARRPRRRDAHTRPPTDKDADHMLVRVIECVQGSVQVEVVCEPIFDYGREPAQWAMQARDWGAAEATCSTDVRAAPALRSAPRDRGQSRVARATRWSRARSRYVALGWATVSMARAISRTPRSGCGYTEHYWRDWLAGGRFPDHRWRGHLHRSALTLKGLTYAPDRRDGRGATTSLPETPQGERNWDYRYCWMRDATFTLWGLHALGFDWEADDFMQFVADLERDEDGGLQIMYGVGGERDLAESTLDHLGGYEGARPVRIGNGAYNQKQNDVFGAVLDSIYLHTKIGRAHPAAAVARDPGSGQVRDRGLGQAGPGHLGGARGAQALRLLEADVLGGGRSRRAPGRARG